MALFPTQEVNFRTLSPGHSVLSNGLLVAGGPAAREREQSYAPWRSVLETLSYKFSTYMAIPMWRADRIIPLPIGERFSDGLD